MPRRTNQRRPKPTNTQRLITQQKPKNTEINWQQNNQRWMVFSRKEVQERINHLEKRISQELAESHYHLELARHYLVKIQELQAEKEALMELLNGPSTAEG